MVDGKAPNEEEKLEESERTEGERTHISSLWTGGEDMTSLLPYHLERERERSIKLSVWREHRDVSLCRPLTCKQTIGKGKYAY